jgi:endonuclease-3 related protein
MNDSQINDEQSLLLEIYSRMRERFDPLDWWPGETPFEVCIGAILTQNTAWTNVAKAIDNLRNAGALSVTGISEIKEPELARLIRPSGYFNQKAKRLKTFVGWLNDQYDGDIREMSKTRLPQLRAKLLSLTGIGPETADCILLYAANKVTFVVDAYTRRIFSRHGFIEEDATYDEIKKFFEGRLPRRLALFNDYHAQIVETGKHYCLKKEPECEGCPLEFLWKTNEERRQRQKKLPTNSRKQRIKKEGGLPENRGKAPPLNHLTLIVSEEPSPESPSVHRCLFGRL